MRGLVLIAWLGAASGCNALRPSSGAVNLGGSDAGAAINQDAHVQHCLATLNQYRAQHGVTALVLDDRLSEFSLTASRELQASSQPHGYFEAQLSSGAIWNQGFCHSAGENETAPGWNVGSNEDSTVDKVLQEMMDEGPGGGHYENIVNPQFVRVGVGIIVASNGSFYLSNDFSGACN
jgi:uncharacterized protein YkwD